MTDVDSTKFWPEKGAHGGTVRVELVSPAYSSFLGQVGQQRK